MDRPRVFGFSHPDKELLEDTLSRAWDISRAKDAIRLLIGPPAQLGGANLLGSALYTYALIAYVRCFSTGRRQKLAKDIFDSRPDLAERHERFKSIRDKHLSHAVDSSENVTLLVAAVDETSPALGIGVQSWFFSQDDHKGLSDFLELIQFVDKFLNELVENLGNQLAKKIVGNEATWESAQSDFNEALSFEYDDPVYGRTKVR